MNLGCLWSATTTDQLPPSPESCRLFFFLYRPPPCVPPPPPRSACSLPLPPRLSAHLQLDSPSHSPVPSGPAQPSPAAAGALPCPGPAFRPPSPPPLTDRPEKATILSRRSVRAKILPIVIHPSTSAAVPSSPSLFFRTALLSSPPSSLLSCLFLVGPLLQLRASETSSRIPSRRAHTPGLWRLLFPGSPNQPLSAATLTTTTIPRQQLTSSWFLSPS